MGRKILQQDFDMTLAFCNHERKQRSEVSLLLYYCISFLIVLIIRYAEWLSGPFRLSLWSPILLVSNAGTLSFEFFLDFFARKKILN